VGLVDTFKTLAHLPLLLKLKREMVPRSSDERFCIGAQVALNAERFSDRLAFSCNGRTITWHGFNALANRYAHSFLARGYNLGDTVSVMMENRIEFVAVLMGLNKIGVTAALLNTNLLGRPLTHCLATTQSRACVVGEECSAAIASVMADLELKPGTDYLYVAENNANPRPEWADDLDADAQDRPCDNLDETTTIELGQTAFYIYTSGTTGMPKAAVMSNKRYLGGASAAALGGMRLTENHRLYNCLPLYHATGLVLGVGTAIVSGASTFIRRKFSASNFLGDARKEGTTHFVYIGELCRYLLNTPVQPDDANNPLHTMMGAGLRPDVWMQFKKRFGIKRIAELYAASEGNAGFCNFLNKDMTIGTTMVPVKLVQYDVPTDRIVRDNQGHCIEVQHGEPGLGLIQVDSNAQFEGYTNKEATEKKMVRGAFVEGDSWFNTGDLLRTIDVGFSFGFIHFQFVDRVGDTFRWKGENVSTNEVGEILNLHPDVQLSNVYGVSIPGTDGRAGMAALTLKEGCSRLNLETLAAHVQHELPAYARPVFLRIQAEIEVTGTFKMVKGDLREEGYDLARVQDPLFVMLPGDRTYQPFTPELSTKITSGQAGF
jgi:citronellyl-CoA synthetase